MPALRVQIPQVVGPDPRGDRKGRWMVQLKSDEAAVVCHNGPSLKEKLPAPVAGYPAGVCSIDVKTLCVLI